MKVSFYTFWMILLWRHKQCHESLFFVSAKIAIGGKPSTSATRGEGAEPKRNQSVLSLQKALGEILRARADTLECIRCMAAKGAQRFTAQYEPEEERKLDTRVNQQSKSKRFLTKYQSGHFWFFLTSKPKLFNIIGIPRDLFFRQCY